MHSSKQILQAALAHFARDGYEGASLQGIAEDCGIRKPSIYAHYSSKGDLFLQAVKDVFQRQEQNIVGFFSQHQELSLEEMLKSFLQQRLEQYTRDDEARFFLRVSFFPPRALYEEVMNIVYPFLDRHEACLSQLLAAGCPQHGRIISRPDQAASVFLTLLDGIHVEILYGGEERAARRLAHAWPVYWQGVTRS
ncbi:TetR family transcriptional regulator [Paenibacillus algicola]|uniref:TetR family transcriptional regulator n=1 Tax=Paenibacillus algicola TaxID=2565926 RepID=A0A4P8XP74_9BACL|nr:TetR/AcrR family transcriptional regulator [Paenibacillus algicola]QCT04632.1 TetR family transcriptional regulator [Paenibacillus algicola]